MEKAPDAFRTISEVAEVLDTPAHVLRFWESRFPQICPIKRAGGRRYYRPGDVALLAGIRHLLHDQGLTIRGVQKVLRENGVRHVQSLSKGRLGAGFGDVTEAAEIEAALNAEFLQDVDPERMTAEATAEVVPIPRAGRSNRAVEQMLARTPAPANAPRITEVAPDSAPESVPEAPFVEAEDAGPEAPSLLTLRPPRPARPRAGRGLGEPGLFDDLPLTPRPDHEPAPAGPAEAALLQAGDHLAEQVAEQVAVSPGSESSAAAPPAAQSPSAPEPARLPPAIAPRIRALPRPVSAEAVAGLAPLMARARALQARLAAARASRG